MHPPWSSRPRPRHALPPPWYRRKLLWAATTIAAGVLVLVVADGDGGASDPFVEPDFNTTSSTEPPACIGVANPSLLTTIAADAASAVAIDATSWFVAKPNGATWLTTADPTRDAAGELLPMNDQARADSASRRDVPADDPLYRGHTNDEPAADAARACAR